MDGWTWAVYQPLPKVILLKIDDDSLEDIFQSVRGIRERTPSRDDYPERPELNYGLSGTEFDGQESDRDEKNPQGLQRRPFRGKYSIFYPKMCEPDPDENKNSCSQTLSQDKNERKREATNNEANNENIKQGRKNENMKEDASEANNQENTDAKEGDN